MENLKKAVCPSLIMPFCAYLFIAISDDEPFVSIHSRWTADLCLFAAKKIRIIKITANKLEQRMIVFFWKSVNLWKKDEILWENFF